MFKNKKHVLIATGVKHNPDAIFAGQALSLLLKKNNFQNTLIQKNVTGSKVWRSKTQDYPELVISPSIPKVFTFSLPDGISPESITWEKSENLYKIRLQTKSESTPTLKTLEVNEESESPDLLLFIGNKSDITLNNLGMSKIEYEKISKIIILSNKVYIDDQIDASEELISSKSFSLRVFKLMKNSGLDFFKSKQIYTLLLAGIISHTDGFKTNVNSSIFEVANELIKNGADYQLAYHLSNNNLSINKLLNLSKLYSSIKKIREGVYEASLDLTGLKGRQLNISDIMKVSEIYDAKITVVVIKKGNSSKIFIRNRLRGLDLKPILRKFKGKGNRGQGVIETEGNFKKKLSDIYPKLFVQF